jgi:hypothetical protein
MTEREREKERQTNIKRKLQREKERQTNRKRN